jgi:hypothetical protein
VNRDPGTGVSAQARSEVSDGAPTAPGKARASDRSAEVLSDSITHLESFLESPKRKKIKTIKEQTYGTLNFNPKP